MFTTCFRSALEATSLPRAEVETEAEAGSGAEAEKVGPGASSWAF